MAAKILRIPEPLHDEVRGDNERPTDSDGWDPYEVWRTRVLLPRLQESDPEAGSTSGNPPVGALHRLSKI